MTREFELALVDLADETKPLTRRLLSTFSDLSRADSETFVARLNQLSVQRRGDIVSLMVEYAEERFEMDFVALFRRLLHHEDGTIRRLAVEGLWEDNSPIIVAPLLKLLSADADVAVRVAAATAIGRFVYLAECDELDRQRMATIRQTLDATIANPAEDTEVVRRALESLSYINDEQVRQVINRAYNTPDTSSPGAQRMRESAVFAMGRNADPIWADTVLAELQSKSLAMRYEAARACGELQLKRAVEILIQLVQQEDREVQSVAVWSLGQIGGEKARKALEKWAQSEDPELGQAAAEALDELELSTPSFDLLVHQVGVPGFSDTELLGEDEEEGDWAEDDEGAGQSSGEDEEEWPDDALDL